jgi:ferric-dicitrate binding protein FerR (iron transport regulator)
VDIMMFRPRWKTISRWLDGDLPERKARRVEEAVRRNETLRREIEQLERIDEAMQPRSPCALSPDFTDRLVAALPASRPKPDPGPFPGNAVVQTVSGDGGGGATIRRAGSNGHFDVVPDTIVFRDDTIDVDERTRVFVRLADGSGLYLNHGAHAHYQPTDCNLSLRGGECFIRMKRQTRPFQVRTPSALLTILGTELDVQADGDNRTRLTVFKGKVAFENRAGRAVATHGREIEASDAICPEPRRASAPRKRIAWTSGLDPQHASFVRALWIWTIAAVILIAVAGSWLLVNRPGAPASTAAQPTAAAKNDPMVTPADIEAFKKEMFPVTIVDCATRFNASAMARVSGAVPVNTHLYVIDQEGRFWQGHIIPTDQATPGDTGVSVEIPGGDSGARTRLARLNYGGSEPVLNIAIDRVQLRRSNTPEAAKRFGFGARAPGEYTLSMNNEYGGEVEESFCLFVPLGTQVTQSSAKWTATEHLGDWVCLVWTDRLPKNAPRHVVDVVVKP